MTVLIPTKGRAAKLLRCIKSIPSFALVAIHATSEQDIPCELYQTANVSITLGKEGVVASFNLLAKRSTGPVMVGSDDMELLPGCLEAALDALSSCRHMVGLNVVNMKSNADAFAVVGNELIQERGFLFDPRFEHFFSDTELGHYARQRGLFVACKQAKLLNHHPASSGEYDRTHRHRRMEKWRHDKAIWDQIRGKQPDPAAATPQTS